MTRPPVSVVLPTINRTELLGDCITSLVAELRPGDELIVIDAGADRSDSAAKLLAAATSDPAGPTGIYLASAPGKSRQMNLGVRHARGTVLLLTDDDVRVPAGWCDAMTAAFDEPGVGIGFGHVIGLTRAPGTPASPPLAPGEAPVVTWSYAHGAAMAIRTEALWAVGGFDERLGPGAPAYGEEHDVLLRLREAGWRAVIADAPAAEHLEWRNEEETLRTALIYERGAGAFIGAAIRRRPGDGMRQLRWRLGYLRQAMSPNLARRFRIRAVSAFLGGLAYGLRLRPRRFLER